MTPDFDELVDLDGPRARGAGAPAARARDARRRRPAGRASRATLAPAAAARPTTERRRSSPLPRRRRRRPSPALLIAAAVAAACFGGGYVLANQAHHRARSTSSASSRCRAQQNSFASLRVGSADASGNWPIQLTVNGLKPLQDDAALLPDGLAERQAGRLLRHLRGQRRAARPR